MGSMSVVDHSLVHVFATEKDYLYKRIIELKKSPAIRDSVRITLNNKLI
jgi:hypothetical protein